MERRLSVHVSGDWNHISHADKQHLFLGGTRNSACQTSNGYGFHYTVKCDAYPFEWPIWYMYETWSEDGGLEEMRATGKKRVLVSPLIYFLLFVFWWDNFYLQEEEVEDHGWPIPDELFAWMSKLLRHHGITNLKIQNVTIKS